MGGGNTIFTTIFLFHITNTGTNDILLDSQNSGFHLNLTCKPARNVISVVLTEDTRVISLTPLIAVTLRSL